MTADTARVIAAIVAATFGVMTAISTGLVFRQTKLAENPTYFGGQAIEEAYDEAGIRAGGARERSSLRAKLFQSMTIVFVVAAALTGLYAVVPSTIALILATVSVAMGVAQPVVVALRWWAKDQDVIASTEYYAMYRSLKLLPVEDQRRIFREKYPRLARRLWPNE